MMDKLDMAVARIRDAAAMSLYVYKTPLLLTYSGGKDSDAVLEIAKIAGIPYEVRHRHTTADAPETVAYVRKKLHELELEGVPCSVDQPMYEGKRTSMWALIPQKLIPPTRRRRYCCEVLKETAGKGRFIATGVRWAESKRRGTTRGVLEKTAPREKDRVILTTDNDERRKTNEYCQLLGINTVNPIIDWLDSEVWDFLADRKVVCNPLYCEFSRVGCIGCPLADKHAREREFLRWPEYKRLYLLAFEKMIEERKRRGKIDENWRIGTRAIDIFHWWMEYDVLPGQIDILEEDS